MNCLEISGDRAHRRNSLRYVLCVLLREVLLDHVHESGAAGSGHLLALFLGLVPFHGLISSCHIAAQTYFDHVRESHLKEGFLDGLHCDVAAELAFSGGRYHRVNFLACENIIDDAHQVGLGSDRAERTGVDAVTALDALALVDDTDAVVVVCDRADRAGLLAGTNKVCDRAVRAGLGTHAALFTLIGIDMSSALANADSAELTGIDTCFAHTQTAVVCYGISGKRTFLTCRTNDLNDILGLGDSVRALCQGKTDSLFYQLSLFIYTAAVCSHGTGDDLIDQFLCVLFIEVAGPCQFGCLLHDPVFQTHQGCIICYHILLLSALYLKFITVIKLTIHIVSKEKAFL